MYYYKHWKGGEGVKVDVLFHYMKFCKSNNLEPSFIGLKEFYYLTKGIVH